MRHSLRKAWSIFRDPATRGWLITAVLALLIKVVDGVVDQHWLKAADPTAHSDWEFLVLAVGMVVLNCIQEACLCLYFLWHHYFAQGYAFEATHNQEFQGQLIRRVLTIACFVWAARLRTRVNAANTKLIQLQERTEQKLSLGLQASALAHELRQPLGHLLLQLQLLQFRLEQSESVDPALEAPLHEVAESGRQINSLIAKMTRLLRQPAKNPSGVNLSVVVKRSLWELQRRFNGAAVAVEYHGLEQPAWIFGEAEILQIACSNVLQNAFTVLQTMPPLQRRLRVQLDRSPESIALIIADSGPGLPAHDCRELLMNSSSRDGMGLGLLTVQTVIKSHQGRLSLGRSADLGGAEVRLSFRAAMASSAGSDTAQPVAPAQHR